MKKSDFLTKLKKEDSLKLVEPSEEISKSYLIKSDKCIRVAKLAYEAEIYENAVSEAYYSIYNTIMSLFFKCENHSGSVILIKDLFNLNKFYFIFSEFKKDRIDNQYYILILDTESVDKDKCNERIATAQRFNAELRAYAEKLTLQEINNIRNKFEEI